MTFECYSGSQFITEIAREDFLFVGKNILPISTYLEQHYFKKIKVDCSGLRIYLVDEISKERIDKPVKGVTSWVNLLMHFDFKHYLSLNQDFEKKKVIIAMFKEGIYRAAEFMNWDMNPLMDAFNQIDALNYHFVNTSTKKRFKGVKRYVQLETECQPGFYHYYLVVKEKDELISRHKVVTMNAFYNIFFEGNRVISEMRWEDANTFVIVGKKGHLERIRFEYKVDSDELTRTFNLESDIDEKEFMEEFDLATTEDLKKIKKVLSNRDTSKWHIYI